MNLRLLGSQEMVTALALGGLRGQAVASRNEVLRALEELTAGARVCILVIEEGTAELARVEVDRLKLDPAAPLVVEIPGLAGPLPGRKGVRQLVREALGIRV